MVVFFFQAEDGIRDIGVTGVQTCALPICLPLFRTRYLRFMAKSELYWFPLRLVLRAGGAFPVRRGEGDIEAIRTAVELCQIGRASCRERVEISVVAVSLKKKYH